LTNVETEGLPVEGLVGLTYNHAPLTNDSDYFYKISSIGETGAESPISSVHSATPIAKPQPACELSFESGRESITITWNENTNYQYHVYYTNVNTPKVEDFVAHDDIVHSPFHHTGLVPEQPYYYVITASNPSGESEYCIEDIRFGVPLPASGVPVQPKKLFHATFKNHITIMWPTVPGAETFHLYGSTDEFFTLSAGNRIPDAVSQIYSPVIHSDLVGNRFYYYQLVAQNAFGRSQESEKLRVPLWKYPVGIDDHINLGTNVRIWNVLSLNMM